LDTLIANMRMRAAQCRLLANASSDKHAALLLRSMADEIEADIARLMKSKSS